MKKIITVFVLLMFMLSNIAAFADKSIESVSVDSVKTEDAAADDSASLSETSDDSGDDDSDDGDDDSQDDSDDGDDDSQDDSDRKEVKRKAIKNLRPANIKNVETRLENNYRLCVDKCKGNNGENCEMRCQGLTKKRIITEEKLRNWNQQFLRAKEKFIVEQKFYKEKRETFVEVKKKIKECKDQDTEECKELEEKVITRGKEFLTHTADLLIEQLNKIKARVEASENMDDAEAQDIIEKLDNTIAELDAAKEKVAAATTKEELNEAAKTINRIWKSVRYHTVAFAAHVINLRIGEIIERSEKIESKIECSISAMEEQGKETEKVSSLADEFSAKIDSAKEKYEKAKDLIKQAREIKTETDPSSERASSIRSLVEEAKRLINQAHKDLRDAHGLLKKIFRLVKESGADVSSCKLLTASESSTSASETADGSLETTSQSQEVVEEAAQ